MCAVLPHGEHGAVVRLLTREAGLVAGYVRGGRSRRLRPVLQVGNLVQAELRARVDEQLAAATVELVRSRAGIAFDALGAAALEWLGALAAAELPEAMPYPPLYDALARLLDLMEGGEPRIWAAALVRYELLLLAQLGFGLDLTRCAGGGAARDLAYVSPRSSTAVSRERGAPYADRLLPLPPFLMRDGPASWPDIADGLRMTGYFVERDLLAGRGARILPARERLAALVARRASAREAQ